MRVHHLAAASVSVSCVLLVASCLQSPAGGSETAPDEAQGASSAGPIGEARQEIGARYKPKDFPFVVTVKDDGKDGAAGWQEAEKTFRFVETTFLFPVYHWQCPTRIEMPVRCEEWGRILPDRAAQLTADAANAVVDPLLESGVVWRNRGDEFCRELWHQMEATLNLLHPKLGARVRRNQ
jgi:hypothetical protein